MATLFSLLRVPCSRAGALPQELPALGRGLCHHHLPHLRGPLLPDAHPGGHRGRLVARQVQVSGRDGGGGVKVYYPRTYCLYTVGFLNLCLSYLSDVICVYPPPSISAQDYCLPVDRLHPGTGGPGCQRHPRHHRRKQGWRTG